MSIEISEAKKRNLRKKNLKKKLMPQANPILNEPQNKPLTEIAKKSPRRPNPQQNPGNERPNLTRRTIGGNWMKSKNETPITFNPKLKVKAQATGEKSSINDRPIVAIDCEMVGGGSDGRINILARVSIVGFNNQIIMDKYVSPSMDVTDYRTSVSGIRPRDLDGAVDFEKIRLEVTEILDNKILVGHSLKNDLDCLMLTHPVKFRRDTSSYKHIKQTYCEGKTPSLKKLASVILDRTIQEGEHDSVIDARTALEVYKKFQDKWEADVLKKK